MTEQFEPEIFELTNSISVFAVTAESFPAGVMKAHEVLNGVAPRDPARECFGLSWGGPSITYKAAATEIAAGELRGKGLEEFTIRAGSYLAVVLTDFHQIGAAIQHIIRDPRVDSAGYCVEMYLADNSVRCMVTMKE